MLGDLDNKMRVAPERYRTAEEAIHRITDAPQVTRNLEFRYLRNLGNWNDAASSPVRISAERSIIMLVQEASGFQAGGSHQQLTVLTFSLPTQSILVSYRSLLILRSAIWANRGRYSMKSRKPTNTQPNPRA
jgi:hypothetical protein